MPRPLWLNYPASDKTARKRYPTPTLTVVQPCEVILTGPQKLLFLLSVDDILIYFLHMNPILQYFSIYNTVYILLLINEEKFGIFDFWFGAL